MTAANTTANEVKYFDLHTTGIGYLGRIREVKLKKGQPFWACTIAALHGECKAADSGEKPDYTYFDCNVVGADAAFGYRYYLDRSDGNRQHRGMEYGASGRPFTAFFVSLVVVFRAWHFLLVRSYIVSTQGQYRRSKPH